MVWLAVSMAGHFFLSFLGEEVAHEGGGFFGEDSGGDGSFGVEWLAVGEGGISAFFVACAIDDATNLTPTDGAGTHQAWFDGDIECASLQVFSAKSVDRRCQCLHLGMGGDIVERFRQVVTSSDDAPVAHHDCANRNFVGFKSTLRLIKGGVHEFYVLFVYGHNMSIFMPSLAAVTLGNIAPASSRWVFSSR